MSAERLTVLVAARDEEERIADTVTELRRALPAAEVVVADDGSRDATAARALGAGARVVSLERRGKGQALTLAERTCAPGPLLLCDADLRGDLTPLLAALERGAQAAAGRGEGGPDLVVAAFARRSSEGLGVAKRIARALVAARGGVALREPLSGQRALSARARAVAFPVAAGFGVETRMTIDVARAGLVVEELELDLVHRSTGRDLAGFAHRGRQLADLLLACGPQGVSFRGLRLPLVGTAVGVAVPSVLPVALVGLADDLWSGPERGFRAHLRAGATTGTLKLVAIPLYGLLRTRSLTGAVTVGLAANVVNQLDTRPGRALKAFALGAALLGGGPRRGLAVAVLLAPYDLAERTMLGDAGSNALGAMLGLASVRRFSGRGRIGVIAGLAALTIVGERRSLGRLVEETPVLSSLDRLGRRP